MKELSRIELEGLLKFHKGACALFFYTPFCGTCKLATKMLEVTLEALPEVMVYRCNVNSLAHIVSQWEISSVPCIIILEKKEVVKKVYALNSVADIYHLLKPLQV
jgi:thioredoxin-like negative regulator of GroEL